MLSREPDWRGRPPRGRGRSIPRCSSPPRHWLRSWGRHWAVRRHMLSGLNGVRFGSAGVGSLHDRETAAIERFADMQTRIFDPMKFTSAYEGEADYLFAPLMLRVRGPPISLNLSGIAGL